MEKVRVLVVEDSLTARKRLCEVLAADEGIEVIAAAEDGSRAIDLCLALRPDVVTMDMMLPVVSGLAATEYIMAHCPTPILVVSSSFNRGELFQTCEALAAGALEVLDKAGGDEPDGAWERTLVSTVKLIARIKVITHPRARLGDLGRPAGRNAALEAVRGTTVRRCEIVAVGASTGGPAAIVEILHAVPNGFRIPFLLVLHIGEPFASAFAEWLELQTGHRVGYARDGELIASAVGRVLMAPPQRHLTVRKGRIHLTDDPERHSCRPSVDVLFESVAREFGAAAVGCLLTGMGRDGAAGMLELRRAGALTIAQDEATSVVYGMPREAARLGAVQRVLPLRDIGPMLAALARAGRP